MAKLEPVEELKLPVEELKLPVEELKLVEELEPSGEQRIREKQKRRKREKRGQRDRDRPVPSRVFADLIRGATSQWANWNSDNLIKAGDFGILDDETGSLKVKGNIYDPKKNSEIFKGGDSRIRDMVEKNPAVLGPKEGDIFVGSLNGQRIFVQGTIPRAFSVEHISNSISYDHSISTTTSSAPTLGSSFESSAALIIMSQPQRSYIPPNTFLKDLTKVEALKGMHLVTRVYLCPTYSCGLWCDGTLIVRKGIHPSTEQDRLSPLYSLEEYYLLGGTVAR